MQELIQTIECLNEEELHKINSHVDSLNLSTSTVFGWGRRGDGGNNVREDIRSSTSCSLKEGENVTNLIHKKMNEALNEYKLRVAKINDIFNYYPVVGGYDTKSHREAIQILDYDENQEYKFHHDTSDDKNSKEYNRTLLKRRNLVK